MRTFPEEIPCVHPHALSCSFPHFLHNIFHQPRRSERSVHRNKRERLQGTLPFVFFIFLLKNSKIYAIMEEEYGKGSRHGLLHLLSPLRGRVFVCGNRGGPETAHGRTFFQGSPGSEIHSDPSSPSPLRRMGKHQSGRSFPVGIPPEAITEEQKGTFGFRRTPFGRIRSVVCFRLPACGYGIFEFLHAAG